MNEIYRDRSDGTAARREDLLRRRRDELVTMPHAVRRVVVARRARIVGSLAVIAVAELLVLAVCKPAVAAAVAHALPGMAPAPLSTLLFGGWLVGLATYLVSRARAEHRFAVAMSHYVLPGHDVDHDVERLSHERPDAVARAMAHRLEVGSAVLPVLASALLVPATVLFAVRVLLGRTWPAIGDFEVELAGHAWLVGGAALAGTIAAIAMTGRPLRRPAVATIAGAMAGLAFVLALAELAWWPAVLAMIAAPIALVTRRLARERDLIEAEDPAAGSELFTLRGLYRSVRHSLARARCLVSRAQLRRRPTVIAATAMFAAGLGSSFVAGHGRSHKSPDAVPTTQLATPIVMALNAQPSVQSQVRRMLDGGLSLDVGFRDHQPVMLDGLAAIPQGWHVAVKVRMIDAVRHGDFRVTAQPTVPNAVTEVLHATDDEQVLTFETCADSASLALRFEPLFQVQPGEHVGFTVEPMLTLANCQE